MARDWPSVFDTWAKPVSDTEGEKCERAERMIRAAIAKSPKLQSHQLRVAAQGSYRNDTNVRQDSDVDICVCCTDVVITDYAHTPNASDALLGYSPSPYTQAEFRNDVGDALRAYFGGDGVTRGDKAFDVHANTVRVDADVVAAFQHRLFYRNPDGTYDYNSGTNILADSGKSIMNFPDQHYDNGCAKNVSTGYAFKRLVRIVKRLRNEMADAGAAAAKPVPSYLMECLLWNVPDEHYRNARFFEDVRDALLYLYDQLNAADGSLQDWLEVNGIKYLFRPAQPWTREIALNFVRAAWAYVGFE
ncbi:MAG: nucleotidyltransferase domain-containing protein [Gemmatimonadaceae bacterium]